MNHRIIESREADLSSGQRLFLRSVSMFDPRRGSFTGHFIAFVTGMAMALFALWLGAQGQ